jgi:hypothetical protein
VGVDDELKCPCRFAPQLLSTHTLRMVLLLLPASVGPAGAADVACMYPTLRLCMWL